MFILSVFISSCELEPNLPNKIEVQVLNFDGFTCNTFYWNDLTVSTGEYPISLPDYNGFFFFENIVKPYDLNIRAHYEDKPVYSYLIKNLTNSRPVIILNPSPYESLKDGCLIHVNFPPIAEERLGIIKFISKDLFYQDGGENIEGAGSYSTWVKLYLPRNKNSIEGKLLFFEFKGVWEYHQWGNINIEQYDKYGSKDISLNNNEIKEITFSPEDINYNPDESQINYELIPSPNSYAQIYIRLNWDGYNSNSFMNVGKGYDPTNPGAVVPVLPDLSYKVRVIHELWPWTNSDFNPFSSVDIIPGGNGIVEDETIRFISPVNNDEHVNLNTPLEIEDNGEKGIYVFGIIEWGVPEHERLFLFTDRKNLKISDLNCRTFKIMQRTEFTVFAAKLSGFNSTDEFTIMPYIINSKFTSIARTEYRSFKTESW